jgi:uncharacterized membrane protein YfhO/ubiquinone/menaquinone biosynthesis C-methylase UbiE
MRVKKTLPIIFLLIIWFIFAYPCFIKKLIPAPLDFLVAFFNPWQPLFKIPIKNNALPDVVTQIIPMRLFSLTQIKNGQIPFWNPYNFSGSPHLANIQSAVFYPLNFLMIISPFHFGYGLFILIQPLSAGLFTYLFCRQLKLTRTAAFLAAISFMFSGFITSWFEYGTLVHAILWLPLCLFLIEKIKKRPGFSIWHLFLILSLTLSLLAGHLQISLYLIFTSFFYLFVWLIKQTKNQVKLLLNSIIVFTAPFFLVSFQLLPSFQLYSNSLRSQVISTDWYHFFQTPPSHLVTLLAPDFFGNPVTRNFWSKGSYVEMMGYIGLLPLILATFALLKSGKLKFFKILSLISLLFALPTPFSEAILHLRLPVFATSSPSRIFCLFCFSTAILAGLGIDTLKAEFKKPKRNDFLKHLTLFILLFSALWFWTFISKQKPENLKVTQKNFLLPTSILVTTYLSAIVVQKISIKISHKIAQQIFILLILTLSSLDLFRFSFKFTSFTDSNLLYPNLKVIKFIQENQGINRTFALFDAQQNLPFQVFSPEGYDPLSIKRYQELISTSKNGKISLTERTAEERIDRKGKFTKKLLDILAVKYVIQGKSDVFAFPTWDYPQDFEKAYEDENLIVFENKKLAPRFFLTNNPIIIKDDQKIIDTLLSDDFNQSNSIVIENEPEISLSNNPLLTSVKLLKYQPSLVSFVVDSNDGAFFYLSDSFYPNWQALVDGKKTKIYRANYTFRAIEVPAGNHTIEFKYYPQDFLLGLKISLTAAFLLVLLLFINFVKKLKILILPFDVYIRHKIVSAFLGGRESVLDVGGGLDQLKKFSNNQITTTDIRDADIIMKGNKLPFKNSQFDTVASIDTLEHISQKERQIFINDLIRVAKKKIIIAAPLGTKNHQLHEEALLKKLGAKAPPYLKEHVKYNLPTLKQIKKLSQNKKTKLFFSGNFYLSEKLFRFHLFEIKNKFFNRIFYYFKFTFNILLNLFLFPIFKKRKYSQSVNRFFLIIEKI